MCREPPSFPPRVWKGTPERRHPHAFVWRGDFSGLGGLASFRRSVGRLAHVLQVWCAAVSVFSPILRAASRCPSDRHPGAATYRDGLWVALSRSVDLSGWEGNALIFKV